MSGRLERRTELEQRILRCVPDFGSGEAVGPLEVVQRLGLNMTSNTAAQHFKRLCDRGLIVRLRPGAYTLPRRLL